MKIERIVSPNESIDSRRRASLLPSLLHVARTGFGCQVPEDDVMNHVFVKPHILYIIKDKDEIISFASFRELGEQKQILYLDGIVVLPEYQKRGIFKEVNEGQIRSGKYAFMAGRTQNPAVYRAIQKLESVGNVYPNESCEIPSHIKEIGVDIAERDLGMKFFEPRTFVERKTYGDGGMYGFIPSSPVMSNFFDDTLKINYKEGDSVLIVADII